MIKILKSKGIVFSAFLICSFYYIISYRDERRLSVQGVKPWTNFERLRDKEIQVNFPNENLLGAKTRADIDKHSKHTDSAIENYSTPKITSENLVYKEPANWDEMLMMAANKFMNMLSPPEPLSDEQLSTLRQQAVIDEKLLIRKEMENYNKSNGEWTELLTENRGKPVRNVIFTTWRSGSTFLGEVVTSHPATFYHYEPLLHFEIVQVRSGELAEEALRVLKKLLQCDYFNLDDYIKYGDDHPWLHSHNWRLWRHCSNNIEICLEPQFLSSMCQLFPFQIMKTVRMRLKFAEELLNDESLDIRLLFLVRDPRGTLQSRKHRDWCPPSPDCSNPKLLCSDMVDDYYSALQLRKQFPDRLMIIRYEDLSLNPYNGVKKVFDFFKLDLHPEVQEYIKTHTEINHGGVSSTFRDSKTTPFRWIKYFQDHQEELMQIQKDCRDAMNLWGYKPIKKSTKQIPDDFGPLLKPPWKEMIIANGSLHQT